MTPFVRLLALLVACLCLPLVRAAGPSAEPSTTIELTIVGTANLNPNVQGRPSPVVLRFFELTDTNTFDSSTFEALFAEADTALPPGVLAQGEFTLRPGDIQEFQRQPAVGTRRLGIAVGFRDLSQATWRLSVPIEPGRTNFILVEVDRQSLRRVTAAGAP